MRKNAASTYYNSAHKLEREGEVPSADFDGGCNNAGGTGACVGVCSGFPNFPEQNFSYIDTDTVLSQYVGAGQGAPTDAVTAIMDFVLDGVFRYMVANGTVAPGDGVIPGVINETGETLVLGDRVFAIQY